MNDTREVYILLRMRHFRYSQEPEVFDSMEGAKTAFEEYTKTSWDDNESLAEEMGADPDELLGGPFAGTRILTVTIDAAAKKRTRAA